MVGRFLHDFKAMPDISKRPDQPAKEGNAYRVRGREGGGEEDLQSAMDKYEKATTIITIHGLHCCKALA